MNKDKFLVKDGNRAEWGVPEGYPWKESSKTVIEWDGDETGLTEVVLAEGVQSFFKVSDLTPSVAELLENGVMISPLIFDDGGECNISDQGFSVDSDDIALDQTAWFAVVYKAGASLYSTYVFPEPGIYFGKQYSGNSADDNRLTGLTYGSETTHPISSDFLPLATPTAAGTVKQASAVADVTAAPTAEEFNALLKSLRDAGILATS